MAIEQPTGLCECGATLVILVTHPQPTEPGKVCGAVCCSGDCDRIVKMLVPGPDAIGHGRALALEHGWASPEKVAAVVAKDGIEARLLAPERERVRLREAAEKAAETFEEFAWALRLLEHDTMAEAAEIAGRAMREAAGPEEPDAT